MIKFAPDSRFRHISFLSARPAGSMIISSESSCHPIRVRLGVGDPVYHPSKPRHHRIRLYAHSLIRVHRNPVVIEFGSESAAQSDIHRNPGVIKFGSGAGPARRLYHPSESSRHRIRVRVGGPGPVYDPSYHPSALLSFGIQSSSNSDRRPSPSPSFIGILPPSKSGWRPQSIIHPNPVVIEHSNHRNTVVIHFW